MLITHIQLVEYSNTKRGIIMLWLKRGIAVID